MNSREIVRCAVEFDHPPRLPFWQHWNHKSSAVPDDICNIWEMDRQQAGWFFDNPAFLKKVWDKTKVRVRVNMDVEVISRGPWERIRADADRAIGLVRGRPNVCLGTGALPYETPPDNVLRLREYVKTS